MIIWTWEPCDNCGEHDEHTCQVDGEEYGPYPKKNEGYVLVDADLLRRMSAALLMPEDADEVAANLTAAEWTQIEGWAQ